MKKTAEDYIHHLELVLDGLEPQETPIESRAWLEGFICGLSHIEIITEEEEQKLWDWLKEVSLKW